MYELRWDFFVGGYWVLGDLEFGFDQGGEAGEEIVKRLHKLVTEFIRECENIFKKVILQRLELTVEKLTLT